MKSAAFILAVAVLLRIGVVNAALLLKISLMWSGIAHAIP